MAKEKSGVLHSVIVESVCSQVVVRTYRIDSEVTYEVWAARDGQHRMDRVHHKVVACSPRHPLGSALFILAAREQDQIADFERGRNLGATRPGR